MKIREIKIRAWDGKQMIFPGHFSINNQKDKCLSFSSFDLMQYTGFKTDDGKELYEGDFIECYGKNELVVVVVWNYDRRSIKTLGYTKERIEELKNIHGFTMDKIRQTHKELTDCYFDIPTVYKIVGNIYENPDLIVDLK